MMRSLELILLMILMLHDGSECEAFTLPTASKLPYTTTGWTSKRHVLLLLHGAKNTDENDSSSSSISSSNNKKSQEKEEKGFLSFFIDPFESNIPPEAKDEIYRAEGNTAAAQARGSRIALYAVIAVIGIGCGFFNGFLTELRNPSNSDIGGGIAPVDLADAGFGWVQTNPLFSFLFLNKIGGGLALIMGAGSGVLAEMEWDSRRQNAERIWEELQRRRQRQQQKQQQQQQGGSKKKKRRESSKELKRMAALSEVLDTSDVEKDLVATPPPTLAASPVLASQSTAATSDTSDASSSSFNATAEARSDDKKENGGVFQSIQSFYEKADSMAASQALLLNKRLEEQGWLEKVTDESGLRVIGRDAAAKLAEEGNGTKASSDDTAAKGQLQPKN